MTIKTGDMVSIKRGKLNGQEGEVIAFQEKPAAYVLKMADGTFTVQNVGNVKAPTEATITQDELAAVLMSTSISGHEAGVFLDSVIHNLDAKFPGFANRMGGSVPA
jgi:hypothetical protein